MWYGEEYVVRRGICGTARSMRYSPVAVCPSVALVRLLIPKIKIIIDQHMRNSQRIS